MAKTTRERWIEAGFQALSEQGADGISAERLARRLGVTRGSFYHHFASREDFVRALLGEWERSYTGRILALAEPSDSAETRLLRYLAVASGMDPRREVAIRAWAMRDPLAAEFQSRVDRERLAFAQSLCGLVTENENDAEFFANIAHLCFVGAQQTAKEPDPAAFAALFFRLFEIMRRATGCAESPSE